MKRPLNIALLGRDFLWGGGTELLRSIANALLSVRAEHKTKLFLLLPIKNKLDTFADLQGIIRKTAFTAIRDKKIALPKQESVVDASFLDFFENVDGEVEIVRYNEETGLVPALQRIEADVVMPAAGSPGESFPLPWVGYVYDFQHKHFPEYFSARECLNRDILFATMLRDARAIIVNSRSVKDDIDKYFPYRECKVFTLPFSATPVLSWLEDGAPNILERYKLPLRYFLISNQLWIHKSHSTAFRALAIVMDDECCADLHIVCTGKMEDHRFPEYVKKLQEQVDTLGLRDRVHFLSHIPKIDQIAIMKNSIAVLQPTLFEGGPGGGSVYDAVSLGVPAIISDIPINLEIQNEENVFYFEAGSPDSLAEKIKSLLEMSIVRPSKGLLILRGEERKRLLCEVLLQAIECTL